ncbi:MAG: o-succinylbenzoate synthase [Actinomycetales bacterium]|nr:o-succinylbenzoate synthase [Micrococcales bacterium]PQM61262.1 MAG: o-succinylbenzoate synthase [Actinomycetales bacterium]HCL69406.1 o-succinylbenzoate synthase [Actinomycetota bacterium]
MTIDALRLHSLQMPLVRPFRTSFGTQYVRDVMLVEAIDSDGAQGWGECVTLGWPGYNAEYTAGAIQVIKEYLAPIVLGNDWTPDGVDAAMKVVRGHHIARASVGTAVLDVWLRRASTSLGDYLGATRAEVDCGVSVGIPTSESIEELLEEVGMYVDAGYRRIKLKIEPGWDIEPVAVVRERWPTIPLQVDANQAYSREHAHHLARLDEFDLLLIEQPLEEEDWWGHTLIARACSTPICLDESILSTESAESAIEFGAASNINIKPGRVAGFLEAKKIHDLCLSREVPVWCGGMLETGIGRAANVALAALPGFTLPGDTSASNRYYAEDVTEPFVLRDGRLAVPTGPGIGVVPIPENLRSMAVAVEELTSS